MTAAGASSLFVAAFTVLSPGVSFAARATALEATVFVRLIGHVKVLRGTPDRVLREQLLDLREVEVGSGSGFIVSPHGWVITNHHVVTGEKQIVVVRGEKLEVSIDVTRIEVVLPSEASGQSGRRYDASIYSADPELDLAVLRINGSDLPYVGLGDSDVLVPADAATAVGYPLGRGLDLEHHSKEDASFIPSPSVSTGGVAALRHDQSGERRYLQLSVPLNPGNSGGPVVDAEGYVVGVAHSRVTNANAIAFAVPINRVKSLLQKYGLDSQLPFELLVPGGAIANGAKGITVRAPAGFEDRSPLRLHVEASAGAATSSDAVHLRIDRVATGQALDVLERALFTDAVFERFQIAGEPRRVPTRIAAARRVLSGLANGSNPATGEPLKLVYTLVDLGREKIVARYSGPADAIAANRSLLHASLAEVEASPLLTGEVTRPLRPGWDGRARVSGDATIATIAGWVVEPGVPWPCASGLPAPSTGVAISPPGDFMLTLRAGWHASATTADPHLAARACSPQAGDFGETSYVARATAWGIDYSIQGVFLPRADGGLWQLEMIVPAAKSRFVADLFSDWIAVSR